MTRRASIRLTSRTAADLAIVGDDIDLTLRGVESLRLRLTPARAARLGRALVRLAERARGR